MTSTEQIKTLLEAIVKNNRSIAAGDSISEQVKKSCRTEARILEFVTHLLEDETYFKDIADIYLN